MTSKPPVDEMNYPTYLWDLLTDKVGAQFQTLVGNIRTDSNWGVRVWRIPKGGAPELIYFLKDGNGHLSVDHMTKELRFLQTDSNRRVSVVKINGYIHPADCPDSTVVNINESQVALLKQMIATATATANRAESIARDGSAQITVLNQLVSQLQQQNKSLQNQINVLQSQLLNKSQIEDIVWSKLRDMNYLYRLAFIDYPKSVSDHDINAYVIDLVSLIRKVTS